MHTPSYIHTQIDVIASAQSVPAKPICAHIHTWHASFICTLTRICTHKPIWLPLNTERTCKPHKCAHSYATCLLHVCTHSYMHTQIDHKSIWSPLDIERTCKPYMYAHSYVTCLLHVCTHSYMHTQISIWSRLDIERTYKPYMYAHSYVCAHSYVTCRMHAFISWHASCALDICTCNTLQHTATHCNTLQHCNSMLMIYVSAKPTDSTSGGSNIESVTMWLMNSVRNTLQHTATHCNTLQHRYTYLQSQPTRVQAAAQSSPRQCDSWTQRRSCLHTHERAPFFVVGAKRGNQ